MKDLYALPLDFGAICYLDDLAFRHVKGLEAKVELYAKFIAKMLESDPDKSNDVFMLDGEIYRLAGYEIQSEPGKQKTLTAKFLCTSDITHLFENDVKTE